MKVKLFTTLVFLLSLTACASTSHVSSASPELSQGVGPQNTKVVLGPGDVLDIKFRFVPELNYQQAIRPDGKISLQMVDEVMAAGMTPNELDDHLTQLYASKLKSPDITVFVVTLANQVVYVGGEVETPGMLPLVGHMTVAQAVMNSGGFRETADPGSALIIRKGQDNQPVPVQVDLQSVLAGAGTSADVPLQPADIVYIPKSPIAKANKFVRQYIQDLFLFRGVNLGFTYELHADND